MAHLYCNGGNRFNFVSIRNNIQNNFGGGYSYGCSMPSFGGIFSNWGPGMYPECPCRKDILKSILGYTVGNVIAWGIGMFWGGNNGLYSGIGYTSGSTQGQKTTGNDGNGKDTDFAKIDSVHKNIIYPDKYVKDLLEKCELDDCKKAVLKQYFKAKLEILDALEKGLDGVNDTENKTYIDNLKNHINQLASSKGIDLTDDTTPNTKVKVEKKGTEEHTTPVTAEAPKKKGSAPKIASNDTDKKAPKPETFEKEHNLTRSLTEPNDITWNEYNKNMIPSGWSLPKGYTKPNAEDISDKSIIKVEDTSKKTTDIPVNTCKVSPAGKDTNDFPATLEITSENGKIRYYHYAGENNGCPVYITPDTDINHNVYVLCKQGNKYKLMQFKDFSGYGKGDHQVK